MSLKPLLKSMIETEGPLPVSTYMTLCLHHPEFGYYARGGGIGRDFTTAPELSQVFGELLGLWAVNTWRGMDAPTPFTLAEWGGGRGTLMRDARRAAALAPDFMAAHQLHMLDASPALLGRQVSALETDLVAAHSGLSELPHDPLILIANELLDCLPARAFSRSGGQWHEKLVGLTDDGELGFGLSDAPNIDVETTSVEDEIEVQPGFEGLVAALAARPQPFHALFVDYGPSSSAPADTLRGYKDGAQVDPLAIPGDADLTVDVDFGRLARLARQVGLEVAGPLPQGLFLGALGIETRMRQLIAENPEKAPDIHQGVATLVEPDKMGERFKVICLSSAGLPSPAGF